MAAASAGRGITRTTARERIPARARSARNWALLDRARRDERIRLGAQVLPRGLVRLIAGHAADDRGIALDVVEPESVELGREELPGDAGVGLEAHGEDSREIALRLVHLLFRRAVPVELRDLFQDRGRRASGVGGVRTRADLHRAG